MRFSRKTLAVAVEAALALSLAQAAYAENELLPEVQVSAEKLQPLPALTNSGLNQNNLLHLRTNTSDTAKMLDGQPGVSLNVGGGVSSLPAIHGMSDDRVRTKVDGMDLISACGNHMNPALSYIDPANVASIKVLAGITPVSQGGDSIAGTIMVDSSAPEFAQPGEGLLSKGQVGTFYRSNNKAQGFNASATLAGESLSMRYTGSTVRAQNYKAGGDFHTAGLSPNVAGFPGVYVAGNEVASTKYQTENHALNFGLRHDNHLFDLKLGVQNIPYQGFANQYMDMLQNSSQQINLNYTGQYGWGSLQARVYNEHTRHYMNFLQEKQRSALGMPMNTAGQNTGMLLKGDILLSERDTLRLGTEYQRYRMSDWWAPTSAMPNGMMSPNTFWNINNGQRDRMAIFGEWEARWTPQWVSQFGIRTESVKTNAGTVQGYNNANATAGMMPMPTNYLRDATAFNALNRQHTDQNVDVTALARYTPDERKTFEFGFAQKTRSPNLYERYTWSTSGMSMNMNNWFGDANGYVGNPNLKPEVARTVSASFSLHDTEPRGSELKFSPYYTHVQNYIDAVSCTSVGLACSMPAAGFRNLSLANQSARLYGADLSSRLPLTQGSGYGDVSFFGLVNYVNGKNLTTGDNLFHIMPLNARLALEQRLGNWTNTVEAVAVKAKTKVQAVRGEFATGGYGLLNLRSSYEWKQVRLDLGVENLFDKFYVDPLGGAYVGQRPVIAGVGIPGMGRSINAGLTVKF
ncbi:MAG: TonB-dependent receptor [Nitrosomonadales bacterium]|nr:TonB-dependent receptor [Nitrosomonadales bacterium]